LNKKHLHNFFIDDRRDGLWNDKRGIRDLAFPYCPIRGISVERRGTRVKRFFVSEAHRAELENLTEERWSGTPGDCTGASFWYFLREKVRRNSSGASGPGNLQSTLIERTMMKQSHLQRHNLSLPLFPLVKGIRGRSGWGLRFRRDFYTKKVLRVFRSENILKNSCFLLEIPI
jgi:hypothetical protein